MIETIRQSSEPITYIQVVMEKIQATVSERFTDFVLIPLLLFNHSLPCVIAVAIFCTGAVITTSLIFFFSVLTFFTVADIDNYTQNIMEYLRGSLAVKTVTEIAIIPIYEFAISWTVSLHTHHQILNIKKHLYINNLSSSFPFLSSVVSYVYDKFFIIFPEVYVSMVILSQLIESVTGYNLLQHLSEDEVADVVNSFDLSFSSAEKIFPQHIQSPGFHIKMYNKAHCNIGSGPHYYRSKEARFFLNFIDMFFTEGKKIRNNVLRLNREITFLQRYLTGCVVEITQFKRYDERTYYCKAALHPSLLEYDERAAELLLRLIRQDINTEADQNKKYLSDLYTLYCGTLEFTQEDFVTLTIDPHHILRGAFGFEKFEKHIADLEINQGNVAEIEHAMSLGSRLAGWNDSEDKSYRAVQQYPELFAFCSTKVLSSQNKFCFNKADKGESHTIMGWILEKIQLDDANFIEYGDLAVILKKAVFAKNAMQYELTRDLCRLAVIVIEKHDESCSSSVFVTSCIDEILSTIPNLPSGMR